MGFDNTFLLARWDHPLTALTAHRRIEGWSDEPVPDLSWSRDDGWQCYAPDGGYYDGELVPPVLDIAAETGGPVLGIGVARSDFYRLSFIEVDELRTVAHGGYSDANPADIRREMVDRWGQHWPNEAAASLTTWAASFGAKVSNVGLWGALATPQVFAEQTVFDVLALLTLVPNPLEQQWWSRDIPDGRYAIHARDVGHRGMWGLKRPDDVWNREDLVLAFTDAGVGAWSLDRRRWESDLSRDLSTGVEGLRENVLRQGWTEQPSKDVG
ncbi:hypothetical protein [Micromonospora chersina]|uniref:hypothetical protein n=1 Tax=Micromonospora chersina TaxID=47854 RepID=UPI00371C01FD